MKILNSNARQAINKGNAIQNRINEIEEILECDESNGEDCFEDLYVELDNLYNKLDTPMREVFDESSRHENAPLD